MKLQQELDRLRDENSSLEGKYHNEYATRMKMETACELMATKFKQLEEMKNDIKTHEQYQDLLAKTQRLETEKRLLEKKEEERKKLNQLQDQDMQEVMRSFGIGYRLCRWIVSYRLLFDVLESI